MFSLVLNRIQMNRIKATVAMCLRLSLADLCNNSSSMAETTDGWTDGGAIIELRRWTEIVNVHFGRDPYTPKGDSNSKPATIVLLYSPIPMKCA